jgi:hypothetical protein
MPPLERTYTSKLGRNLFRKLPPFRRRHSTKSCQQAGWTHPPQRHRLPEAWHRQSPVGLVASEGTVARLHFCDWSQFSGLINSA